MKPQLVRCDAVAPQPWRNGGGFTRELLAWPRRDDWALRIGVADVDADGPFSSLPGVDRWFAVLAGAGVRLALPEGSRQVLPGDEPLAFAGEAAPHCELIDGPTRDLNLMLRRGCGRAALQRARAGESFAPRTALRALFVAEACTLQPAGSDALPLPACALTWAEGNAHAAWRIAAAAPVRAWWIHFEPAA